MAYSAATYKGDGSQSTFMIPFDYLQKDFVKVTINEVDKVYAQDYNVDGRELSFPTAPPSGSIIKIYRETPTDRMVKWNEGSVLTSSNMTTQQIQELHLIEETTYNLNISSMVKTEDKHKWEGQYLPITHVGDPTDDSDVVNLGTIKKEETGFLASVRSQLDTWLADLGTTYNNYSKGLKDSFDSYTSNLKNQFDTHTASLLKDFNDYKTTLKTNYDSYTSNLKTTFNDCKDTLLSKYNEYLASLTATKDAVKDSEANASKYKDEAKSASDSAKESASQCANSVATCTTRVTEANQAKESASASANTATTKATESGNSAALAKKWAMASTSPDGTVDAKSAKTWAEEAKSSEQKATTSANNAKASEDNAKASEIASALSAKNAQSAEANAKKSESASATSATAAKSSEVNAKASEVAAAESAKQAAHGQINADWNETNANSKAFIKNKPNVVSYEAGQYKEVTEWKSNCVQAIAEGMATDHPDAYNYGVQVTLGVIDHGGNARIYFPHNGGMYLKNFWGTGNSSGWLTMLSDHNFKSYALPKDGIAVKATADAAGNNIQTTYAKKSDISTSVSTNTLTVTGETSVPTANAGNSSNAIASTEFVAKSIASLVGSAPESLNTLNELAKALGNDPNFATTILNELSKKMNSTEAEGTFVNKSSIAIEDWRDKAEAPSTQDSIPVFKKCSASVTKTPQNGLMLSYGGSSNLWRGQLFLSDNPDSGVWYGGYGGTSTHSGWKRLANYNEDGHLVFPNGAEMWVY